MQAEIGYLVELREDLLEAAWRESLPAGRETRRRVPRPRSRGWLVAAIAAGAIVAAAATGFVALRLTEHPVIEAVSGGAAHAANDERNPQSAVPRAMASPAPIGNEWAADLSRAGVDAFIVGPGDLAKIVKTAGITVVVPNGTFQERFGQAADVADRYGGFIESSTTQGTRSGRLTIRVDAGSFGEAMDALRALGRVETQTVHGRDVTAQYVDLQGRLRISLARLDVLFGLMDKATTIEQTLRVQNALDDVQLRIEQLKGELKVLNDQTDKATIELSMRETSVPVQLTQEQVRAPSVGSAWRHSIAGFFRVVFAVVVGLGYLVPAGIVALVAWGVVRLVRRRRAVA
jgi:hypothetical protein